MANTEAIFNAADQTTPGYYKASQTALLLLDFHSSFVNKAGGPNASAALAVASKMRVWAKSRGIVVIHALLDVDKTPFPTCKGADRLSGILTAMKSGGVEEPAQLLHNSDDNDITFTRSPGHVSALKSPGILEFLQEQGIKSLILTGLSTSGCVMRTAVSATDAEFVVTVISDACADAGEGVHDMLVEKLLPSRAYVATTAEFRKGFETSGGK
jgi:nicotinamidase-related amidase